MALHTRRQLDRCLDRPTALTVTDEGWLLAFEPVVPVSHAASA
jgi:hypothetical protein